MAKPEWGAKHYCSSCGKAFYDMKRDPIICPSCGAKNVPEKLLKSRKITSAKVKAPVKPVVEENADVDDDDDADLPDDDISVQADDNDDDLSAVSIPKNRDDDS